MSSDRCKIARLRVKRADVTHKVDALMRPFGPAGGDYVPGKGGCEASARAWYISYAFYAV